MKQLEYSETLIFYDTPQLIVAHDVLATGYICLLEGEDEDSSRYLCAPVSPTRLVDFKTGEVDLRTVFKEPEIEPLFVAEVTSNDFLLDVTDECMVENVPESWFPDEGFYLKPLLQSDVSIVNEARHRQRAVLNLRLNPPEARSETKIRADTLGQAVRLVQRVAKYAYGKASKGLDQSTRRLVSAATQYELEVFAFSPGSFTVHMQSVEQEDLVGYVQIARAFGIIDEITELAHDPVAATNVVAKYGGHLATAYIDLVNFIVSSDMPVAYEWAMPKHEVSISRYITLRQAKPLYEELTKRTSIGYEEKVLTGILTKIDTQSGAWRIVSEQDEKQYAGYTDQSANVSLSGLIVDSQRYEFVCEERLEEARGTGREVTKLYLKSYQSVVDST